MKKAYLAVVVVVAIGLFFAYRSLTTEQPVNVTVETAAVGAVEAVVANTRAGSVKARHRAHLTPTIGGRIDTLHVRRADVVEAGQVLLTLWNKDLQAERQLAEAEAAATEASAREICRMAELAKRQAERQTVLHRNRVISESVYDEVVAAAQGKKAACEAATARIEVAAARVAATEATLERTILIAPFAGIVAEVNGEIGEYLTPSPPGIATLPAIDLIGMDGLYVTAPIDEIDAAQVRTGMEVRISLDAFPRQSFPGRVRSVAPYVLEVAKQARTVEIEAEFLEDAAPDNLLAGYSADVEIILDARSEVVRIPSEAVLEESFVFVLRPETRRVERRSVETGLFNWRFTEVVAGLEPGELVVTSVDRRGLAEGVLVEIENYGTTTARR